MRPLPPAESLAALAARPAPSATLAGVPYSINVTYDGAPARVVITSPDGQVISDTTRPRDTSCDDFAPDTSSDPNADGMGCLPESYGTLIRNSRPGVGYVQFTAMDTGNIVFTVEPFIRGNFGVGYWGGPAFVVRPGQTYIFQVTLPERREDGPVVVVPLTGQVDTFVPPR